MKKYSLQVLTPVALACLLSACGGGGGGDSAPAPVLIQADAGPALSVDSGVGVSVSGRASTTKSALSALTWSVQASDPTSAALVISNENCAAGSKSNVPGTNNGGQSYVASNWQCDLGVKVPSLKKDSTYRLTLTATDTSGGVTSSSAVLTVKASPAPEAGAVAVIAGATQEVTSGKAVEVSCIASGGRPADAGYSWQWKQVSTPEVPVTLTATNSRITGFVAPVVGAATEVSFECRATDEAAVTGSATKVVRIMPPSTADATLVANAGLPAIALPGDVVSLDAKATGWFDRAGKATSGPNLNYAWEQVAGPAVTLVNANAQASSFTLPSSITDPTTFEFKVTASANGVASSSNVRVSADPAAALGLYLAEASKAVSRGENVMLWALTRASASKVYYSWTQVSGPAVPMGGVSTSSPGFVVPLTATVGTVYTFRASAGFKPISVSYPGIQSQDVVITVTQ